MSPCICTTQAPAPFDHLVEVHRQCIAHHPDVILVAAGWERNGSVWTHPERRGLWTREQAMETL